MIAMIDALDVRSKLFGGESTRDRNLIQFLSSFERISVNSLSQNRLHGIVEAASVDFTLF